MIIVNPVSAQTSEVPMDWIIEGQSDDEITKEAQQIIKKYESTENKKSQKVYDKFVTGNKYAMGDYKITIESPEGQTLNGVLIEQIEMQEDNFLHKIKYYDRFSDGYVQVAEALLDPIGEQTYFIDGAKYDHNPNSNLEYFVLERGYSLDNLDAVPNDIFSPMTFTLGREMMSEAQRTGEGEFDLRVFSPNNMYLEPEEVQAKMVNDITEQTNKIFEQIISGKQPESVLQDPQGVVTPPKTQSENIFDNVKTERKQFQDTRHVRDMIQEKPDILDISSGKEFAVLLLIPVVVGLAVLGYVMKKKLMPKKLEPPIMQFAVPQTDYAQKTFDMLAVSRELFNNNQEKEAYEVLGQSIRYYFTQRLEIYKELTTFELLEELEDYEISNIKKIRDWLLLCGSVEFARHHTSKDEFSKTLSEFSKSI